MENERRDLLKDEFGGFHHNLPCSCGFCHSGKQLHDINNIEPVNLVRSRAVGKTAQMQRSKEAGDNSSGGRPVWESRSLNGSSLSTGEQSKYYSPLHLRRSLLWAHLSSVLLGVVLTSTFLLCVLWMSAADALKSTWPSLLGSTPQSETIVAHIDDRTPECLLCPDWHLEYVDC